MKLINHGLKFVHTIPSARSDNTQQVRGCAEDPQAFLCYKHAPTIVRHTSEKSSSGCSPLSPYNPWMIYFAFLYEASHRQSFLGDANAPSQKLFAQTYKDEKLLTKAFSSTQASAELLLQYLSCIYPWSTGRCVIDILSDVFTDITL